MTYRSNRESPGRRRPATRARWALAAAAAGALAACSGELTGVLGSPSTVAYGSGAGGQSRLDPALLGRWRRVRVFTANDGTTHTSETTWAFAGDGSALRTVVSRNVSFNLADGASTSAFWRTEPGVLVVTFRPPEGGVTRFAYVVDRSAYGDVLYLAGEPFARVGP
jgi:hypothetical protein